MKMRSGSRGKTRAHVHAWLHSLEQQTHTNTQPSTHTEVHLGEDTHPHADTLRKIQMQHQCKQLLLQGQKRPKAWTLNVCLSITIILTEGEHVALRQSLFWCACVCVFEYRVYVWVRGLFMQHSSSLRRPRPHISADLTVSDRTSPFSAIISSS